MDVALIHVPYHLGHEAVGTGVGPATLLDAGLADALAERGHECEVDAVRREGEEPNEVAGSFAILRLVAERAREAVCRNALPLALAGNCMTSIAMVAALEDEVGVVWLDAHPDFDTTEGTETGFADGMGLSILTGTGWDALRRTIPGYRAVAEADVVLVGARDAAPAERERLDKSLVRLLGPSVDDLAPALDELRERVTSVYFHLDLDVLDPSEGRANAYAAPGGLSADDVERVVRAVGERFRIRAASVTAYDPASDAERRIPPIALRLTTHLVDAAAREAVSAR
jgi:arginase